MSVPDLKSGMFCKEYLQPDDQLQDHIRAYIVLQADFPDLISRDYTLLPQVHPLLFFNLGETPAVQNRHTGEYLRQYLLIPAHHQSLAFSIDPAMKILAVQGVAGSESHLFQDILQLDHIQQQLLQCKDAQSMCTLLDTLLGQHLQQEKQYTRSIRDAVRIILDTGGNVIIRQLERATFQTKRTLERGFLLQTGLHLKMFCRITRFRKAIAHIEKEKQLCWAKLAQDCGYYDQTHFINEFHYFAGCLPGAYTGTPSLFEQAIA
ncbi:helix-turn-helix domain-containing protein [Chitinophaga pinensis]|nr:helix-turn-helix domain-containing protein [Chitinophaga pinensis]